MKGTRVLLSLTCCAAAATAHAQSNVTLYGIIDDGFFYTSNRGGGHAYQMQSGTLSASRFGFKGREDLGGGYATIFALENGFNVNSGKLGQGGRLFGRQSWVGIAAPVGNFTLGRQYDLATDFIGPFESGYAWSGGPGTQPGDHNDFNGSFRLSNALKFVSADFSGLRMGATYSLGGVAGSPSTNSTWGVGVTYVTGPFAMAGTLSHINSPNTSVFDGTSTTVGANVSGLSFSGFASARTLQIAALGASFRFGGSTIGGTYSNTEFKGLGSASGPNPQGYQGTGVLNSFELNYRYQFTPAVTAGTAFIYTRVNSVSGAPGANYRQVNLGTDYQLSKRTDVYLFGYGQSASGTNSVGQAAVAQLAFTAASSSNRQLGIAAGLRHRF
ncbi:Outer membrane porin protein [Paraburkholderia aspalathi]|uniref:porin n=1 Tax=Paraburkholderia aspalathi TaxID=1324617 RepID=UPI001B10F3A5|nr:porin [Paraburkholderia aspalathi]CAE6875110.1 Outer membrane porin protein [Paraburkholderia aspalathi]